MTYNAKTVPLNVVFTFKGFEDFRYRRVGEETWDIRHPIDQTWDRADNCKAHRSPEETVIIITPAYRAWADVTFHNPRHNVTATLDGNGIVEIHAGCFTGTLAQARKRAKDRDYYHNILDKIQALAESTDTPTEVKVADFVIEHEGQYYRPCKPNGDLTDD